MENDTEDDELPTPEEIARFNKFRDGVLVVFGLLMSSVMITLLIVSIAREGFQANQLVFLFLLGGGITITMMPKLVRKSRDKS